jgi:GntR family transcriptional regulator
MGLNREIPVPLYFQLEELLLKRIDEGTYLPGEAIPTEDQLEREFGVSRTTVRQAVARLALGGKVTRIPGKGTFVTEHRRVRPGLRSILEDSVAPKMNIDEKVIVARAERPPRRVTEVLGVAKSEQVIHLQRVRFVDGEPLCLYDSYLPARLVPNLHQVSLVEASLYKTLESVYGLTLSDGEEEIEPGLATAQQADLLGVRPGSPVLVMRRVTFLSSREPIECTTGVLCGGRYRYVIQLGDIASSIRLGTLYGTGWAG